MGKDHVEAYVEQQVTVSFTGDKPDITGKLVKVSAKTLSLKIDDGKVIHRKFEKIAEVHLVDEHDNIDDDAADADDADDADDAAGTGLVAEAADDTEETAE